MRRGQSLIVWAISEGREAAREVDYLMGYTNLPTKEMVIYQVYNSK
jgi:glutamate synthase (NADPH/NADH) small chain